MGNLIGLTPYVRLGFGYEGNTVQTTYNVTSTYTATADAFYYGTSPNKFFDYIASGIPVLNKDRFAKIKVLEVGVQEAIKKPDAIFEKLGQ